ncbi:MAG TPA: Ppx/GppA phosphatase family protein [Acidimicrobiia bacterium]|nr:Ppx/GppA phosphatase family protein [Acidimicrobiia bacterium]
MTPVAAVDIGTNSVRLLVADVTDTDLRPLDRRMQITRLGQGVDATRELAPDAIDRTVAVLREYHDAIETAGVTRIRATATSAARDATNRTEFFTAARDALGVEPELLTGDEEAGLSFAGATAALTDEPAPYLVIDIGGGSTEFTVGTTEPDAAISIDVGCVRITEQFLHTDPPAPEELSAAVLTVRDHLGDVTRALPQLAAAKTAVGLAGTITTVAAVEQGVPYSRERVHHFRLTRGAAEDVFRTLALEPTTQRSHNPGLEPGRVDTIVGGAIILVATMRALDLDELLVSEDDILDGLARSLR